MDTVTYTEFSKNLATYLNKIEANCTPLLVTRQNASSVVMMSLDDFKAYEVTFHLLSSRNNADRLDRAIKNLCEAKGTELIDQRSPAARKCGLARQSVGRVPRLEGTVEGGGSPAARMRNESEWTRPRMGAEREAFVSSSTTGGRMPTQQLS